MNALNHKAQGSLEYLLLIAAVVMIAAVVIITMTGSTSNTQSGINSKYCEYMDSLGIQCSLKVSCANDGPKVVSGEIFKLSTTIAGGKGPYDYNWSGTGCTLKSGSSLSIPNPELTCPLGQMHTYTVTVTDKSKPQFKKTCDTNLATGCYLYPSSLTMALGDAAKPFTIYGGNPDETATWEIYPPGIATLTPVLSAFAKIEPTAVGSATITAHRPLSCPNAPTANLSVSPNIELCGISPLNPKVPNGKEVQFTLTGGTGTATWWISPPGSPIATITSGGLAKGLQEGKVQVYGNRDNCLKAEMTDLNVFATIPCAVVPASPIIYEGETQQFILAGPNGNQIAGTIWDGNNPHATIGRDSGEAIGASAGTTKITGSNIICNDGNASTSIEVAPCAIAPTSASIQINQNQQFTFYGGSGTINFVLTTIDPLDTGNITIDASGLATAHSAGQVKIDAGRTGCTTNPSAIVTVTPLPTYYLGFIVLGNGTSFLNCSATTTSGALTSSYTYTETSGTLQLCPYKSIDGTNYTLLDSDERTSSTFGTSNAAVIEYIAASQGKYNVKGLGNAQADFYPGTLKGGTPRTGFAYVPVTVQLAGTCWVTPANNMALLTQPVFLAFNGGNGPVTWTNPDTVHLTLTPMGVNDANVKVESSGETTVPIIGTRAGCTYYIPAIVQFSALPPGGGGDEGKGGWKPGDIP